MGRIDQRQNQTQAVPSMINRLSRDRSLRLSVLVPEYLLLILMLSCSGDAFQRRGRPEEQSCKGKIKSGSAIIIADNVEAGDLAVATSISHPYRVSWP